MSFLLGWVLAQPMSCWTAVGASPDLALQLQMILMLPPKQRPCLVSTHFSLKYLSQKARFISTGHCALHIFRPRCAIVGLTEQYIHQQVSKFDYERWRAQLETHVRNSNEDDDAEMDFGPTVGFQCELWKLGFHVACELWKCSPQHGELRSYMSRKLLRLTTWTRFTMPC